MTETQHKRFVELTEQVIQGILALSYSKEVKKSPEGIPMYDLSNPHHRKLLSLGVTTPRVRMSGGQWVAVPKEAS